MGSGPGALLSEPLLWQGVVLGAAGAAALLVAERRPPGRSFAGLAIVVPAVVAGALAARRPLPLVVGAVLLAAGQETSGRLLRGGAMAAGGLGFAVSLWPARPSWLPVVAGVAAVAGAWSAGAVAGAVGARVAVALVLASAGGVALGVPDVEAPVALVGALLVPALVLWVIRPSAPGPVAPSVVVPVAGLVVWAMAEGARGRPASFWGTAGCLGVLVLAPLVARWPDVRDRLRRWWWLLPLQVVAAVAAARTGGLRADVEGASLWSAAVLVVVAGIVALVGPRAGAGA